jgi:hypothetical protein
MHFGAARNMDLFRSPLAAKVGIGSKRTLIAVGNVDVVAMDLGARPLSSAAQSRTDDAVRAAFLVADDDGPR